MSTGVPLEVRQTTHYEVLEQQRVEIVRQTLVSVVTGGLRGEPGLPGPAGPAGPGGSPTRETPTGSIDGENIVFGVTSGIVSGTSQVYLNGLILDDADYLEGSSSVILSDPPQPGDRLQIIYFPS